MTLRVILISFFKFGTRAELIKSKVAQWLKWSPAFEAVQNSIHGQMTLQYNHIVRSYNCFYMNTQPVKYSYYLKFQTKKVEL